MGRWWRATTLLAALTHWAEKEQQQRELEIEKNKAALQAQEEAKQAEEVAKAQAQEAKEQEVKHEKSNDTKTTITHIVKSGDNLTKIAKQYGIPVTAIKAANPSIKNDQIKIGQKLTIPQ